MSLYLMLKIKKRQTSLLKCNLNYHAESKNIIITRWMSLVVEVNFRQDADAYGIVSSNRMFNF